MSRNGERFAERGTFPEHVTVATESELTVADCNIEVAAGSCARAAEVLPDHLQRVTGGGEAKLLVAGRPDVTDDRQATRLQNRRWTKTHTESRVSTSGSIPNHSFQKDQGVEKTIHTWVVELVRSQVRDDAVHRHCSKHNGKSISCSQSARSFDERARDQDQDQDRDCMPQSGHLRSAAGRRHRATSCT